MFLQNAYSLWSSSDCVYLTVPPFVVPERRNRASFQDLPSEIIHQVCSHLEQKDVGAFRRTWYVHFAAVFKYDPDSFGKNLSYPSVTRFMILRLPQLVKADSEFSNSKDCAAIADEHIFRHGKVRLYLDSACFSRLQAISKNPIICKAIKTLEIIGCQEGFTSMTRSSSRDSGEIHRMYSKLCFQNSIERLVKLETIELHMDDRPQQGPNLTSHQMRYLFFDIQCTPGARFTQLRIENVGLVGLPSLRCVIAVSPEISGILGNFARRLSRLDLTLRPGNHDFMNAQANYLVQFLDSTRNLEELKLRFGALDCFDMVGEFDRICQLRFSRLRCVDLSFGWVAQHDLLGFFEDHPNIKQIRLGELYLRAGQWTTVLHRMSQTLPILEKIQFFGHLRDLQLTQGQQFVCGDHLTPWAQKKIVQKLGGIPTYTAIPYRVPLEAHRRDHELQKQRRTAGLPCDLCETCDRLKA